MTGDGGGADLVDVFQAERRRLRGIAYRMLGVMADADDVVQDVWMRWEAADRSVIENPAAWLTTVTTRVAVDRLRRRTREQEAYVGPWLPEPLVVADDPRDPSEGVELAESLTFGFLVMLEELSPAERAAFLLADVFEEPYTAVAAALDRSEEACRQLASRARGKLRRESTDPPPTADRAVVDRFVAAIVSGDEAGALACVHPDIDLLSDGGGARHAARRRVVGADRVVRFMVNLARRVDHDARIEMATAGGRPAVVVWPPGESPLVVSLAVVAGRIAEVRSVLNPAKLADLIDRADLDRPPEVI
ncbi:MAG: RNA polymerase sigma factor SigJ [Actinomycetota bacterium]